MSEEFKVGDFVAVAHQMEQTRLIIWPAGENRGWGLGNAILIYLNRNVNSVVFGSRNTYVKIQPTEKLLRRAKRNINRIFKNKEIDNLTYIELLDKLNEHQRAVA